METVKSPTEDKFMFTKTSPDHFRVESNIISGKMENIGVVWSAPDKLKPTKKPSKIWYARVIRNGTGNRLGPFSTRKAAAEALT